MALNSRRKLAPTVQNLLDNMKVTALAKTAQDGDLTKRGAKPVRGRPDDDEKTGQRQAVHEKTSAEERKKNQDTGYDITREMTEVKINREKITRKTKDKDGMGLLDINTTAVCNHAKKPSAIFTYSRRQHDVSPRYNIQSALHTYTSIL